MKTKILVIIFLIFCSLLALMPLFQQGFFQSDDGEWMVIRFSAFHQALRDGQFPVRFLSRLNNEYGYPVANFLYPGFMYLAEPIKILGFGFVETIKISFGISLVGSALFTFFWLSKIFNKTPAFIGALAYLYAPYHLFDIYKRGSIGEILALATVPFILWQIERKSTLWISLGITLLILSHNTLALLFLPLIFLYSFLGKKFSFRYILYFFFFGFGIAAFFWIPALFDLQYTVFSQTVISNWKDHFATLSMVGYSTFAIVLLSIFSLIYFDYSNNRTKNNAILMLIVGCIAVFLSLPTSVLIWRFLPVSFVQFPFRFLSVAILCTSFLSAFFLSKLSKNKALIGGLLLIVLTLFSAKEFLMPLQYFDKREGFYSTNVATTTVKNEYLPIWVRNVPIELPKDIIEIIAGEGKIENKNITDKKISFTADMKKSGAIRINKIYFPGFSAYLDNKPSNISYNNEKGVMEITVPSGKHMVSTVFEETPIRLLADVISVASLTGLFLLAYKNKRK